LKLALSSNSINISKFILDNCNLTTPEHPTIERYLNFAAISSSSDIIKLFDGCNFQKALEISCLNKNYDVVEYILNNHTITTYHNAMMNACGSLDIIKLLLKFYSTYSIEYLNIYCSLCIENIDTMEVFIDLGANEYSEYVYFGIKNKRMDISIKYAKLCDAFHFDKCLKASVYDNYIEGVIFILQYDPSNKLACLLTYGHP